MGRFARVTAAKCFQPLTEDKLIASHCRLFGFFGTMQFLQKNNNNETVFKNHFKLICDDVCENILYLLPSYTDFKHLYKRSIIDHLLEWRLHTDRKVFSYSAYALWQTA